MPLTPYRREDALAYARKWSLSRNPIYGNFHGMGGDCTNFISQCVYAGAGVMNYTRDVGWYFKSLSDRAAAWTSVEHLHRFLTTNRSRGPQASEVDITSVAPGDVVQLGYNNGQFYHSLFIVQTGAVPDRHNIFICTHTYDADMRALDSYMAERMRFLHVDGVQL